MNFDTHTYILNHYWNDVYVGMTDSEPNTDYFIIIVDKYINYNTDRQRFDGRWAMVFNDEVLERPLLYRVDSAKSMYTLLGVCEDMNAQLELEVRENGEIILMEK